MTDDDVTALIGRLKFFSGGIELEAAAALEQLRERCEHFETISKDCLKVAQQAEARAERAEAKLAQIATVCADNMGSNCNHLMALDFVRQIVNHEQTR